VRFSADVAGSAAISDAHGEAASLGERFTGRAHGQGREWAHPESMLIKPVLVALLAACGVHSNPDSPTEIGPPDDITEGTYFCCHDVDPVKATGDGCVTISEKQVDHCSTVLYCGGTFTKEDGTVRCNS
jgi:hypothetical protein